LDFSLTELSLRGMFFVRTVKTYDISVVKSKIFYRRSVSIRDVLLFSFVYLKMLTHREEIDGLRAIALLPVIFYHAGFIFLVPGGYVGVDIFFVISGYLITSLIDAEMREGTFSLVHFYERRCRRILPALYVILFISCYFAYHCMSSGQLKDFGYSLMFVVTFSSNIFFWWKDDGYFSRLTEFNPLVHTWTLAVEEQFYLVSPLLCYLLAKRRHHLIILLGFVTLLSFFLAQWGGNIRSTSSTTFYMFLQHPWASSYMPIGRAWELLMGSFAAFYLIRRDSATYV
jgi:peptidoglycan/LPS O-acetylase OafA/YrhL